MWMCKMYRPGSAGKAASGEAEMKERKVEGGRLKEPSAEAKLCVGGWEG
jgi:hypothetical protein